MHQVGVQCRSAVSVPRFRESAVAKSAMTRPPVRPHPFVTHRADPVPWELLLRRSLDIHARTDSPFMRSSSQAKPAVTKRSARGSFQRYEPLGTALGNWFLSFSRAERSMTSDSERS